VLWLLPGEPAVDVGDAPEIVVGTQDRIDDACHAIGEETEALLEQCHEHFLFRLEVEVDRSLTDLGALGDLIDRAREQAVLGEDGASGLKNRLAAPALLAESTFPSPHN
jgi:hypothetical protein